eukprot:COSAG05_NODE_1802_length_4058_cov_6.537004_5_plen_179_part_00
MVRLCLRSTAPPILQRRGHRRVVGRPSPSPNKQQLLLLLAPVQVEARATVPAAAVAVARVISAGEVQASHWWPAASPPQAQQQQQQQQQHGASTSSATTAGSQAWPEHHVAGLIFGVALPAYSRAPFPGAAKRPCYSRLVVGLVAGSLAAQDARLSGGGCVLVGVNGRSLDNPKRTPV